MEKSKSRGQKASGGIRAASGAGRAAAAYKKSMNERLLKSAQDAPPEKADITPSKYTRAAQFMVLIGSEEASKIFSKLDSGQVEAISKEIVSLKTITAKEAEDVLEEFHSLLSSSYRYSGSSYGGIEQARRLLYAAFGPEKARPRL
jgi:flagellar motor switch protein FliG